ncbi:hypothetical protein RUND412_002624 [Rhizina undulata]
MIGLPPHLPAHGLVQPAPVGHNPTSYHDQARMPGLVQSPSAGGFLQPAPRGHHTSYHDQVPMAELAQPSPGGGLAQIAPGYRLPVPELCLKPNSVSGLAT